MITHKHNVASNEAGGRTESRVEIHGDQIDDMCHMLVTRTKIKKPRRFDHPVYLQDGRAIVALSENGDKSYLFTKDEVECLGELDIMRAPEWLKGLAV